MPKERPGCLRTIMLWFNFLCIIITGLGYAAPFFQPSSFWPFIFLGMAFPILIIFNFLFIIFWLFLKKWYAILSLICLIMCWDNINTFWGHPFKSHSSSSGISIMSYNAQGGGQKKDGYLKLIEEIKNINPDIICFQELYIKNKRFEPLLKIYPHYYYKYGRVILSKYSIIDKGDLGLEKINTTNGASWVDLNINNQEIRIYNLHLHSNRITTQVNELSDKPELNDLKEKETWKTTKNILGRVKRAAAIRAQQAIAIKKHTQRISKPIIICGDFNDPPQSYTYQVLSKNLNDTFIKKGKGTGFTYNGNIPFLKIDYILTSKNITINSTKIPKSSASDHNPIITTLVLPSK